MASFKVVSFQTTKQGEMTRKPVSKREKMRESERQRECLMWHCGVNCSALAVRKCTWHTWWLLLLSRAAFFFFFVPSKNNWAALLCRTAPRCGPSAHWTWPILPAVVCVCVCMQGGDGGDDKADVISLPSKLQIPLSPRVPAPLPAGQLGNR